MRNTLIRLTCLLLFGISLEGRPTTKSQTEINPAYTTELVKLLREHNIKKAAVYLDQYLQNERTLESNQNPSPWLELAIFYAWSDNFNKSRMAFSMYETNTAGQTDSPLIKADRLLYQSLVLAHEKHFNQAADSMIMSIASRPDKGTLNRILLADSYGALARWYKETGDLFESSRNFDRSINLNRQLGRNSSLAGDLTDQSSVLSTINTSDPRADSVLYEALSIFRRNDSLPAQAQVLNELGVLFNRRGNYKESLKYFGQSLELKSKIPGLDRKEFCKVINNIGVCYQYIGNTDSARFYFSRAAYYATLTGEDPAPYYVNLGANYGNNEQYTQALEYFQRALNSLDPTCITTDLTTNPQMNRITPQLAEFTAYKAHTYHRRYNQLHNREDLINGLNTFMIALEMMDTLRFMLSYESKPYLSLEAKVHFFNALDMALDLYGLTGEERYLEQAFQLSERNKSATLNEFLRTNQAREYMGNVAPWIITEDSIKQIINTLQSKLIGYSSVQSIPGDSATGVQNRIARLTDQLKNIGIKAKRENPGYFLMVYSHNGYPPGEIRKLLLPEEAMVDYTMVHDGRANVDYMVVMTLTRDTLFTFRDTLPEKFRQELKAFRASIIPYVDTRVFREFSQSAYQLYKYLVEPVEKLKNIKKLILLPDDELGFLPFEAFVSDTILPKGSDFRKLNYLNHTYQISYISSHEQLYQFRSKTGKRGKSDIYAFAPFVSKGYRIDSLTLPSLKNSGEEIKTISKYFRTSAFRNSQAGEKELRRAFEHESVITISTHGIMDSAHPMQSRLLLNPSEADASLYLFELLSLKIHSSLVILNACNTGSGQLQVGEGILSMARGFQYAGVPSVIMTLWPVDDQSSATIISLFFQNLHEGMDQREALMQARNTFLHQSTKVTGAPYFWAGQILMGNPGNISIHHRTSSWLLIISLILAAIAITSVLVFYKKVR
jgi:CHAT domain-containing protein/Tfp pilus assembly protein PilF